MLKYQKELKAGIVALIAIISFVILINFIRGKDIFKSGILIYAIYKDVGGLEVSNPVTLNGLKVGKVEKIYFHSDHSGRLVVEMRIITQLPISIDTIAIINGIGLVSGSKINLLLSNKGRNIKNNDIIKGDLNISMFSNFNSNIKPVRDSLKKIFYNTDNALTSIGDFLNNENRVQIKSLINEMNITLRSIKISFESVKMLITKLSYIADLTKKTTIDNNYNINNSIKNISSITNKINKINLDNVFSDFNYILNDIIKITNKINSKDSSFGNFINDDNLHTSLYSLSEELKKLIKDIKLNPKKYFNFSVFGNK